MICFPPPLLGCFILISPFVTPSLSSSTLCAILILEVCAWSQTYTLHAPWQTDTFIAIDHLILALIEEPSIAALMKEAGTTVAAVKSAVVSVRGGKKVDSKGAEENYEALSKCTLRSLRPLHLLLSLSRLVCT